MKHNNHSKPKEKLTANTNTKKKNNNNKKIKKSFTLRHQWRWKITMVNQTLRLLIIWSDIFYRVKERSRLILKKNDMKS
jgi:hypothetical protein